MEYRKKRYFLEILFIKNFLQSHVPYACTNIFNTCTFFVISKFHNVENISDIDNPSHMLKGISERDHCKLNSSVPFRYPINKESRFTRWSTQLKHLSIDNIVSRKKRFFFVVSKDSTLSNEVNDPFSMETQNNKEVSTSFSNSYSKLYTHINCNMQYKQKVM